MHLIIWAALSWFVRVVVLKFVLLVFIFELTIYLVPKAIEIITPWLGTASLTSAFAGLPASVWWGFDILNVSYGVPLIIAAYVTRFLIRRIPFIG